MVRLGLTFIRFSPTSVFEIDSKDVKYKPPYLGGTPQLTEEGRMEKMEGSNKDVGCCAWSSLNTENLPEDSICGIREKWN